MGTALAILLLLALCGFIAYIGDLLGRRLGKKRLSIFGLRPKHTAILLTVVTGVLIAGVTFASALATVPPFQRAVLSGEQLVGQNQWLREQNRKLDRDRAARVGESERLAGENRQLFDANGKLRTESHRLTTRNATLLKQKDMLVRQKAELQSAGERLKGENGRLAGQNRLLEGRNSRLAGENSRLAGENSRLRREERRLARQVRALRVDPYIFRKGQQIRQQPIPPDPPITVLYQTVSALLYDVERRVRERRAAPGEGHETASYLVPPRDANGRPLTPMEPVAIQRWIVQRALSIKGKPLLIRIVADENCLEGRPVPITIDCLANDLVFPRGSAVDVRAVDGGASEGGVLAELVQFLQSSVRERASEKLMVAGDEGLGTVEYDDLLQVVRQIRKAGGPALVVARARQDTYRAGPLYIGFEVKAVNSPAGSGG